MTEKKTTKVTSVSPAELKQMENRLLQQKKALVENAYTMRSAILSSLTSTERDLDEACKYPRVLDVSHYKKYYELEGIATRVVNIFPDETWIKDPIIRDSIEEDATKFEKAWDVFQRESSVYHYLYRIDKLSGIGSFGILLFGVNDGVKDLTTPLNKAATVKPLKVLYLRPFDQSVVKINQTQEDITDSRYGQPEIYEVQLEGKEEGTLGGTLMIHHSRVLHVADLRQMSETYGTPRMQSVYRRLADLEKILAGSGEMFWRGAFPGYAFETMPEVTTGDVDIEEYRESLRAQMDSYANDLQRYLSLSGTTVKSLTPQQANPQDHFMTELKAISVALGVPNRVFMGSEEAKLASTADRETWMQRLLSRQEKYLTPFVVRPFIDRMIELGILPEPTGPYVVEWPPLTMPNEKDKADVANVLSQATKNYVESGAFSLIQPMEFLTMFLGLDKDKAQKILDASDAALTLEALDTPEEAPTDDE